MVFKTPRVPQFAVSHRHAGGRQQRQPHRRHSGDRAGVELALRVDSAGIVQLHRLAEPHHRSVGWVAASGDVDHRIAKHQVVRDQRFDPAVFVPNEQVVFAIPRRRERNTSAIVDRDARSDAFVPGCDQVEPIGRRRAADDDFDDAFAAGLIR